MDYKLMSLTNPHTIRGTPTLKDVERFRDGNGSFHEFCRLKALITLTGAPNDRFLGNDLKWLVMHPVVL